MKKTRLIVDYDYEFDLFGIISSVKFYKLAWSINRKLDLHLIKNDDFELLNKQGNSSLFENFIFENDPNIFQLYKNKSTGAETSYLIPEMNHLDYILKISSESQSFAKEEVLKALREVKWIEYIAALKVETLKSKDNFLS